VIAAAAAQFYREMLGGELAAYPAERTFRGHVAELRELVDRGRWAPATMNARLVLEVIGATCAAESSKPAG
jgi:hypothetical protein